MKRLLTAGIFGTILGIVGAGTAKASIVSSGFLDEKLTEYALSTSLDLKANQSDFTELNTQINYACNSIRGGFYDLNYQFSTYEPESDFPKNIAEIGDAISMTMDIIGGKILNGWVDPYSSKIYRGLWSLNDGWKDTDGTTYLGVKDLNTKIGTLPEGITVQGMYDGWTNSNGDFLPGLSMYSVGEVNVQNAYDGQNTARLLITGAKATTIDNVDYTGPVYPLWKLSEGIDKIGTLPDGITVQAMYDGWTEYGNELPGLYAIASDIFKFKSTFSNVSIGTLLALGLEEYTNSNYTGPIYPLWKLSEGVDKIDSIETKIGTLPAGYDSVGAALTAIKGIAEDAKAAALAAIPDPKQEGSSGKFVLTVDIVGDNATYRWEKIDREGETTTTE